MALPRTWEETLAMGEMDQILRRHAASPTASMLLGDVGDALVSANLRRFATGSTLSWSLVLISL